jgi:hypothetical protein
MRPAGAPPAAALDERPPVPVAMLSHVPPPQQGHDCGHDPHIKYDIDCNEK